MKPAALLLLAGLAVAAEMPPWVRQEAARQAPAYPPKVNAVVLLAEEHVTVAPDGGRTMRERGAIRVLQRSRERIAAWRSYNARSGRIREFRGWLLDADGRERQFKDNEIVDFALSTNETYSEGRAKTLECPNSAPPGSVFAWELVEEEKTIFTQYLYTFQEQLPVLASRFSLSLPPGWEQRDVVFNHAPIPAASAGGSYTWELRNLPWIEDEDYAPGFHTLAPRLCVTFYPPAGAAAELRPLKDWAAASDWMTGFVEPSADPSAAIRMKSADLTAGAASELDKLRAVAAFVQKLNYVSIQMNLTRGGGYTPHRADQVLSRGYGDCKDKATLMASLLRAAGTEAFVTVAYSGDRDYVRPEWPSSLQFNHAIVAVRVSDAVTLPTAKSYPGLGRLLLFDPTDPFTPLGDLPEEEQGSRMLVLAGARGGLIEAPRLPASAHLVQSDIQAKLDPDGLLAATLQRGYHGQAASFMRSLTTQQDKSEVRKYFERIFAQRLGGVVLGTLEPSDRAGGNRFELRASFDVKQFAKVQGNLVLILPGTVVPGARYLFPAKERKLPVRLSASLRKDRISIQLPPGIKVDETPDPIELKTAYGAFHGRYGSSPGTLLFEQSLEVQDTLAPAEDYARVRDFFDQVSAWQQSAVVLVRQ